MVNKECKNQFYAHYLKWEDYQNGMYKMTNGGDFLQAQIMFTNADICYHTMREVTKRWRISTKVNFTNKKCNRKAWLGQAASCLYAKLTQEETCNVWKSLSKEQQENANLIAEKVISEWEKENGR